MSSQKENPSTTEKILAAAADLIVRTGQKEISVNDLAEKANVSRATIYSLFKGDTPSLVYLKLIDEFMGGAQALILSYLGGKGPASTPIERLDAVLRGTLAAFKANPAYGRVVLQQLNLNNKDEAQHAVVIFQWVDNIIGEAKEQGEIADWARGLSNWKIRQMLFVLTRGLLRSLYLEEGKPPGEPALDEKELAIEVLRVLQLYCSEKAAPTIQRTMDAIAEG